ncbi:MAG: hypothetical protein ABII02_02970 [Candidatus Magasanikbacteria bacterium]
MRKTSLVCACIAIAFALTGAGCKEKTPSDSTTSGTSTKTETTGDMTDKESVNTSADIDGKEPTKEELTHMEVKEFILTAEATGEKIVHFEWNVPKDLAGEAEGYRFVRGEDKDPTDPANWWWERGSAYRALDWKDLPEGEAHFRVCVVKDDACTVYSNDVMVNVN